MFKKLMLAGAALASTAAVVIPAAPVSAQYYDGGYYGEHHEGAYRQAYRDGWNRGPSYSDRGGYYDRGGYDRSGYYDRGNYDHGYRDSYRRCRTGSTGTVVGAIAGGLLGNGIAGYGDRGLGTILGAAGGALAGHAIERSNRPDYCRR